MLGCGPIKILNFISRFKTFDRRETPTKKKSSAVFAASHTIQKMKRQFLELLQEASIIFLLV
jgi:hypothetical protein